MAMNIIRSRTKIEDETGCHIYNEGLFPRINVNGKKLIATRFVWEFSNGPIENDLCVCHHCDQPNCVNLDHLFLGTRKENSQDALSKKRLKFPSLKGMDHPNAILTKEQVEEIKAEIKRTGGRYYGFNVDMANKYGVHPNTIHNIKAGIRWK